MVGVVSCSHLRRARKLSPNTTSANESLTLGELFERTNVKHTYIPRTLSSTRQKLHPYQSGFEWYPSENYSRIYLTFSSVRLTDRIDDHEQPLSYSATQPLSRISKARLTKHPHPSSVFQRSNPQPSTKPKSSHNQKRNPPQQKIKKIKRYTTAGIRWWSPT